MRKLVIVTDAWLPQTNGVVTTLQEVSRQLPALGFDVCFLQPSLFKTFPMPGYPEIELVRQPFQIRTHLLEQNPDAIHIATEGPLGLAARRFCVRNGIPFTTSLHTKFPEYVSQRIGLPDDLGYHFLRWFHSAAAVTLCTTNSHKRELTERGFSNLYVWNRGVDTKRFSPKPVLRRIAPKTALYVGRVATEKNLEAFLSLDLYDLNVQKRVVGDGPQMAQLQRQYPEVQWVGYKHGDELVDEYRAASVLVFPSKTDTFGLVMLEALACGTPVAAYPVTGPMDIIRNDDNGYLSEDLGTAIRKALTIDNEDCRRAAMRYGWKTIARRLVSQLQIIDSENRPGSMVRTPSAA